MTNVPNSDERVVEAPLWHPVYDVVAGLGIMNIGILSRAYGSEPIDTLDYFFDGLAVLWMAAGAIRWTLRRRAQRAGQDKKTV
ncbi:MAG: hypothetical protein AB8I08_30670 [Sandaracinaceae bacterium]